MRFASTRDSSLSLPFSTAILQGISEDGGLFYPLHISTVEGTQLQEWRRLSYTDLLIEIISYFAADDGLLSKEDIHYIAQSAASKFRVPDWTQIKQLNDHTAVLELFHGPTYSFKDYAMCVLGFLMDRLLEKLQKTAHLLVATSGDTGSAAIYGFRNCSRVRCSVLLPLGKVSEIQRRQMTTETSPNIHVIQVRGDFDDCQTLLKDAFASDLRGKYNLMAVNSVNFARISCQVAYYFWSSFHFPGNHDLNKELSEFDVIVPTGNFGNILSAYYAKLMGAPIGKLCIASNVNDLLPRAVNTGIYEPRQVIPTIAPSIDIQVSSNFERLLQNVSSRCVRAEYLELEREKKFMIEPNAMESIRNTFEAFSISEQGCLRTIAETIDQYGYLLDPHTGIAMACNKKRTAANPVLIVATAHPGKFIEALRPVIKQDLVNEIVPDELNDLLGKKEYFSVINPNLKELQQLLDSTE